MKIIVKLILFLILFVGMAVPTYAQTNTELREDIIIEQLEERVKDKLEDFLIYLGELASKTLPYEVRETAYEENLKLFIGRCEPYKIIDLDSGREQWRKAVQMQTSSVNSGNKFTQPMKSYFNKLKNSRLYTDIVIEQAGAVRIDNFMQVGPDKYVAVAHYFQVFKGYRDKQLVYTDKTEKSVKVYIDSDTNYNSKNVNGQAIFDIKLGDMKVLSTERVN